MTPFKLLSVFAAVFTFAVKIPRFVCPSVCFWYTYVLPRLKGEPPNEARIAEFEKRMKRTLELIENVWLKDTPYLTGDKITIADLLGVCEIEQPRVAGYDARTEYPVIAAWMERVRKDLTPHYDEAHSIVNKLAGRMAKL